MKHPIPYVPGIRGCLRGRGGGGGRGGSPSRSRARHDAGVEEEVQEPDLEEAVVAARQAEAPTGIATAATAAGRAAGADLAASVDRAADPHGRGSGGVQTRHRPVPEQ